MEKLKQIPRSKLYQAQIAALARIHLWVTGETHLRLNEFAREARAILIRRANVDGIFEGAEGFQAQTEILRAWGDAQSDLLRFLQAGMRNAARLPFSLLAEEHQRLVKPAAMSFQEAARNVYQGWIEQQFALLIDQANTRILDGLNLSGRVWRIDRETRDGINGLIINAISTKQDAWSLAKDLEGFLGASQDCPRWTSKRLYGLTKAEIAGGDLAGLVTGDQCDGQGVAYKALRLARTEIQTIHDQATTAQLAASPWVKMEQIKLSEQHPEPDICDDVVGGGEDGQGIYPVGTITLPLHPQCLCYKVSVSMSDDDFIQQMRGWMSDSQAWPEMDAYASNVTGGAGVDLSQETELLSTWLFGGEKELEKAMKR